MIGTPALAQTGGGGGGGGGNVNLNQVGGVAFALGQAVSGSSLPVVLPAAQITALTPPAAITNYAQETGGNLASIKADTDKIPSLGQALAAGSVPIVLTALQLTALTPPTSVTVTQATAANLLAQVSNNGTFVVQASIAAAQTLATVTNVAQLNGVGPTFNSTATSGKQGLDTNILSILGTAPTTAGFLDIKGADGNVFVRQTTASNLNAQVVGGSSSGGTPSNPVQIGGLAKTALPTAVSDAQVVENMADKFGRSIVLPQAPRDLVGTQITTITDNTEHTIVTAANPVFNDLISIVVVNTSATPVRIDIRDTTSGSIVMTLYAPAGDMRGVSWQVPYPQTSVNTNWTATSSASVTDLRFTVQYIKNR